jgi:uncharacterized protein involved in exopolysaccharide biosynthesis
MTAPDRPRSDDDILFIEIAVILLRQRWTLFRTIVFFAAISVVIALMKPTLFSSSARFLPESSGGGAVQSGALALAQQFGVAFGSGGGERTPQFYAGLITSDQILRQVVTRKYRLTPTEDLPDEADLMTYYDVPGETNEERVERAIVSLRDDLAVSTEFETGIVGFTVTTTDPVLSRDIAQLIIELVNEFDLASRRSQASADRVFAEERLRQLNEELIDAEEDLKTFLMANRSYSTSPELQFEYDRLQRVVGMHQELVTSLMQSYENARIEEVRNTPVIAVIDAPHVPAVRDPKGRIMIGVMGLIVGGMVGVVLAFLKHYVEEDRKRESPRLHELSTTWRAALSDLVPFSRSRHSAG